MTTTTITMSINPLFTQAKDQQEQKLKRVRSRNVSWQAEDKLCQVRLFAAEDAPFLSSVAQQELYEAKRTKFMHAVAPVSSEDVPPGFEDVAVKRAKLDAKVILTMIGQVSWRTPEKLFCDPTWQIATGYESSEVAAQCNREVKVLEAVYPRASVIPPSPMELQSLEESLEPPQVFIIPLEEADDGGSDEDTKRPAFFGETTIMSAKDSGEQSKSFIGMSSAASSPSPSSMLSAQSSIATCGDLLVNSDLDVAAAAAAAYAVIKAKENGVLVDHELLIKILSNPRLIETVVASNPGLKGQLNTSPNSYASVHSSDGVRVQVGSGPLFYSHPGRLLQEGKVSSVSQGTASSPIMMLHPYSSALINDGGSLPPGWSGNGAGLWMSPQGRVFNNQESMQNGNKELPMEFMQHGNMGSAQLRHSASLGYEEKRSGQDSERYQSKGWGQRWNGGNVTTYAWSDSIPQKRPAGLNPDKSKRLCLFYNTSRGCRKGANCEYVHDTGSK